MPKTLNEIRSTTAELKNITYTQRIEDLSLTLHSYQDSLEVAEALAKKSEEVVKTKGTERMENEDGEYICILTDTEEDDLLYRTSCYAIEIFDNDLFISGSLDFYFEVCNHKADPIRLHNAIHRFRIDSSTRFVERGGDLGDRPYPSRNVLIEKAQEMINGEGGLGLVIAVQNGTVASVALSS